MGSKSTSSANQTSSVVDNRIATSGDGNVLQFQGDVQFAATSAAPTTPGGATDPKSSQAIVYAEAGAMALTGNDNRIVFSDLGAISQATEVSRQALSSVQNLAGSFQSTVGQLVEAQKDLAESVSTGGASSSQKTFLWLALGAFAFVALRDRK